jgi:hypothetical protein
MTTNLYSRKLLFCKLLKLWQAHRDSDFDKMEGSRFDEPEIEKTIKENEPLMQEINYCIFMTIFLIAKEDRSKEFIYQFM